ncbi:MAG: CHRD domain-containing protein [Nocardioides sp.]
MNNRLTERDDPTRAASGRHVRQVPMAPQVLGTRRLALAGVASVVFLVAAGFGAWSLMASDSPETPPVRSSADADPPPESEEAVTFAAELLGENEVGSVGSKDGRVTLEVTIDPVNATVGFAGLESEGVLAGDEKGPTALHIHRGGKKANGEIVCDLTEQAGSGQSSGFTTVSSALAREMARDPEGFYFNYHTAGYPEGAVRAQLGTVDEVTSGSS